MPLEIGSQIAHYTVTALIGEGGMGQVYQGTGTKLNHASIDRADGPTEFFEVVTHG